LFQEEGAHAREGPKRGLLVRKRKIGDGEMVRWRSRDGVLVWRIDGEVRRVGGRWIWDVGLGRWK
jgi:hypothetical protein